VSSSRAAPTREQHAPIIEAMRERATIRDVAARAGVSSATVSYVLNGKGGVGAATAERVRAAAAELDYRPNAAARSLTTRKTGLVGVVLGNGCGHPGLTLTFFGQVLEAISRRLPAQGYEALLVGPTDLDVPGRVDGAILVGVSEDDPIVRELADEEVPCVGVDFETAAMACGYVGSDNDQGVRLVLWHLCALGHRRIAHIAGSLETLAGTERLAAFRREAETLGLHVPDEYVRLGDFSSESGYRGAQALVALPHPPTAIVAASDLMALAAFQAVRDLGSEPGRDVAVVGFDDLEAAGLSHPRLTTVRQDRDALGAEAAGTVVEMIEHPEASPPRKLLPVELVVRASSGERVAA
jgi:DNA-binding LacI/PurR family transcriptional regulator